VKTPKQSAEPAIIDRSGLTDNGRAVNDPRVEARPVGEVKVDTDSRPLFNGQEAPPVTMVARDIPRASNDPRGRRAVTTPQAATTTEAAENKPQTAAPITEDLFSDTADG